MLTLRAIWGQDSEVDDQRVRERVHQSWHAVVRRQEGARRALVDDLAQVQAHNQPEHQRQQLADSRT